MTHRKLSVQYRSASELVPYEKNARKHSKKQIRQIADSMERFGFTNPVLVTADGMILAGHGRVLAAKLLRMDQVPTILVDHLTETERRAYILADNKLALNSTWNRELLGLELQDLVGLDLDPTSLGFSLAEIDLALDDLKERLSSPSPHGQKMRPPTCNQLRSPEEETCGSSAFTPYSAAMHESRPTTKKFFSTNRST